VWAWGGNQSGQIGNSECRYSATPFQVQGIKDVTAIVAGAYHTSALKSDGSVWAWGFNGTGQLGNGDYQRSSTPVRVSGLENVRAIAAGDWHMAALKQDGSVWAWGSNYASQLGDKKDSFSLSPVKVAGVGSVADITAAASHTIAIAMNDSVWAWGDAGTGQWGNGISMNGSVTPVPVLGYNGPLKVAAVVNPDTVLKNISDGSSVLADSGIGNDTVAPRMVLSKVFNDDAR
jgi:alpha-tubulin suppressor-like RCC1 family protein